ncbi:putative GTP-binding domain protein [Bordetella holmesii 70147]|nr:putative GTP-binding domain protein [Bordetella holmesii 44057]EWM41143.1 putative GTP-binding domain protein [Bordetella holmesii 35009]EWM45032.1 putative GTP-binding domain protein [Bordetella holmesii 70147]
MRLGQAREALLRESAELEADVDRLASWRAEYEQNESQAPWLALEAQAAQAQARLQALAREQEALDRLRQEADEARRLALALREQIARDQQDSEALGQLRADATAAAQAAAQASDVAARNTQARQRAESALLQARAALESLQEARRQSEMRDALRRVINDEARLTEALQAAQESAIQGERIQAQLGQIRIDAASCELSIGCIRPG